VKVTGEGSSQIDEVMSGSSYYSQNDFRLHFGLGQVTKADHVEVNWPSGLRESFRNLPANHLFVLQETKGVVETRKFR
jgi:enediyne biosynthesis protein E4